MKKGAFLLVVLTLMQVVCAQNKLDSALTITAVVPAVLYEGDHLEIDVTITNKTATERTGQVVLQLTDATNTAVDGWFQNVFPVQFFTAEPNQGTTVSFPVQVPYLFKKPIQWRIVAQLPTDTLSTAGAVEIRTAKKPVEIKKQVRLLPGANKTLFAELAQSSTLVEHQNVAVEYVFKPVLQAAFSLPFAITPKPVSTPHVCTNYVTYALAAQLKNQSDVAAILDWKNSRLPLPHEAPIDTLEQASLQRFYDSVSLAQHIDESLQSLRNLQLGNGGFPWFLHGPPDALITLTVLHQLAQLQNANALPAAHTPTLLSLTTHAWAFLDSIFALQFSAPKPGAQTSASSLLTSQRTYYFFVRGFYKMLPPSPAVQSRLNLYLHAALQSKTATAAASRAQLAFVLFNSGKIKDAESMLQKMLAASVVKPAEATWLDDATAINIQLKSLTCVQPDSLKAAALQQKLLALKTSTGWQNASATASACFALLPSYMKPQPVSFTAQLGETIFTANNTYGVLKKRVVPPFVQPELGQISTVVTNETPPRDATLNIYWNYFSDSTIRPKQAGLQLKNERFLLRNKIREAVPAGDAARVHAGDTMLYRITVTASAPYQLVQVHLPLSAAFALSKQDVTYQTQGLVKYYTVIDGNEVVFAIPNLPQGRTVLEFTAAPKIKGTFSGGPVTILSFDRRTLAETAGSPPDVVE